MVEELKSISLAATGLVEDNSRMRVDDGNTGCEGFSLVLRRKGGVLGIYLTVRSVPVIL